MSYVRFRRCVHDSLRNLGESRQRLPLALVASFNLVLLPCRLGFAPDLGVPDIEL